MVIYIPPLLPHFHALVCLLEHTHTLLLRKSHFPPQTKNPKKNLFLNYKEKRSKNLRQSVGIFQSVTDVFPAVKGGLYQGMGNCMDSGKGKEESTTMEIGGKEVKIVNDVENKSKGIRVKMVLTKEELQWLMLQLKTRSESGAARIEDVLAEIEKSRKKGVADQGWKPSLDCISEIPEVFEMHK